MKGLFLVSRSQTLSASGREPRKSGYARLGYSLVLLRKGLGIKRLVPKREPSMQCLRKELEVIIRRKGGQLERNEL